MKKLLTAIAVLILSGISIQTAEAQMAKNIDVLPALTSESTAQNRIWVGTFQIVWNELMDEILHKPIKFAGYDSIDAKELNKKTFTKSYLNNNSYYVKSDIVSPDLKTEIETAIKNKFNETSDILDLFDWSYDPQRLFIYAMLKKDFKFKVPFDKLPQRTFGQNPTLIDYFGINEDSSRRLYKNVSVMFYNANNDFAVKLFTKSKDIVILYRTDDDTTFDNYFKNVNEKAEKYMGSRSFNGDDKLSVPDFNIDLETNFPDVEKHRIKGTNYEIDQTIETIKFKMDNHGVKLKSEAAIMMKCLSLPVERGRNFSYNDNFVLFLIENGKKTPYYAMRVHDAETFNKTSK